MTKSPEEGIPEGGPIPLHRDTTISSFGLRRKKNAETELEGMNLPVSVCIYMYMYMYI